MQYLIIAQSYTTSQRIKRIIQAVNQGAALTTVHADLERFGFYVVDCKLVA